MTYVKICGITNVEDAQVAAAAGADLLGFIFVPKTPRYIEPEHARAIVTKLRARSDAPKFVGVFVNASLEDVRAVLEFVDFAQLHGSESPAIVGELSPRVYKALRPRDENEARAGMEDYRAAVSGNTPAFIVDAFDAHKFGGTGIRADWQIAAQVARAFPILLAGGLNATNVADAIRVVQPWGVDVSSGVERAPGLKDREKVREFIRKVKREA